jgi:hypothetical protein
MATVADPQRYTTRPARGGRAKGKKALIFTLLTGKTLGMDYISGRIGEHVGPVVLNISRVHQLAVLLLWRVTGCWLASHECSIRRKYTVRWTESRGLDSI